MPLRAAAKPIRRYFYWVTTILVLAVLGVWVLAPTVTPILFGMRIPPPLLRLRPPLTVPAPPLAVVSAETLTVLLPRTLRVLALPNPERLVGDRIGFQLHQPPRGVTSLRPRLPCGYGRRPL